VELRRDDTGGILIDNARRQHHLNNTAVALWELCDGATTVDEMVEAIAMLFTDNTENVVGDVDATLRRFTDVGIVVWK
jgi:hypothetical protein